MSPQALARMIDHTVLKAEATPAHIDELCEQALEHGFYAVCVNPMHVAAAVRRTRGSGVRVASVTGFPLGNNATATKVEEARRALDSGASEIDMVLAVGALVAEDAGLVRDDIAAVAQAVHHAAADNILKVILESAVLSEKQIQLACQCCVQARADFVKTSTGFHPAGGATTDAVRLLKKEAAPLKVKASGGIRDLKTALAMIEAGADRLGCSASVTILQACRQES